MNTMTMKSWCVLVVLVVLFCGFAVEAEATQPVVRNVITIYNHTDVHLNYQLRVLPIEDEENPNPQWSEWKEHRHAYLNGGYMIHYFNGKLTDQIQIRFDMIGGDGDNYTEQIYNLPFNVVRKFGEVTKRDGKPYSFKFNGTKLLEFKTFR